MRGAVIAFLVFFVGIALALRSWEGLLVALVGGLLAAFKTYRTGAWVSRNQRAQR